MLSLDVPSHHPARLVALFAVLAVVVIIIYTEMFRDAILSRTTETAIGKLDGGFWEKIIPVLGIPLLTLIASQFSGGQQLPLLVGTAGVVEVLKTVRL